MAMQTDLQICDICAEPTTHEHCLQSCICGASWCNSCIRRRFLSATKDMVHMPPTCCGSVIMGLHLASPHLSGTEAAAYRARFDEWRSLPKIYCPVSTCSAFIADTLLDPLDNDQYTAIKTRSALSGDLLQALRPSASSAPEHSSSQIQRLPTVACPVCSNTMCLACKQSSHTGQCPEPAEHSTAALLRKMGYKRCPACATGVKRMWGCSHILCVCGAAWCWVCERLDDFCDGGGSCDGALSDGPDDLRDTSSDIETDEEERDDEDEDEYSDAKEAATDEKEGVAVSALKDQEQKLAEATPLLISEEQQNVRDVVMSDRHDAQDEGRNFGEEAGEIAALSCCRHRFNPLRYSDTENDDSSLECHRCWTAVRPIQYQPESDTRAHKPVVTHKTRAKRFSRPKNVLITTKKDAESCARCHIMFCSDCTIMWKRRQDLQ